MSIISRITVQKRNQSRYNIFLKKDNQSKETYGFSVDEDLLVSHRLYKGVELDELMIKNLQKQDDIHKSYQMALRFLSYRMRTKQEIYEYLIKKEVEPEHLAPVLDKLKTEGFIDDQAFGDSYIRTKMKTSNKGPLLLKNELIQKGVTENVAQQSLSEYPWELQLENAKKWAEKKIKTSNKRSFKMELNRVKAGLIRKGFSNDIIQEVMEDISGEQDAVVEWEALVFQGEKLWRKYAKKHDGFMLKNKVKEGLYRKGFSFEGIQRFIDEYKIEE